MTDELQKILLSKDFLSMEFMCNIDYTILYHYTSPNGLLGILGPAGRAKLWFTRYDSLNDVNERKDILEFLHGYCRFQVKSGKLSPEFSDAIMQLEPSDYQFLTYPSKQPVVSDLFGQLDSWTDATTVPCDTYLCCFSEEPDLLPMWNYYSKSQHYEGYSIGFSSYTLEENRGFEKGYSIELKRVIYTDSEKRQIFDKMLLPLNKLFINGSNEEKTDILTAIQGKLDEFQFVFKNSGFQHEKEIRAILRTAKAPTPNCKKFEIKYRNSNGYIVPYLEYDIQFGAVREIKIAPLLQSDISKRNISEMLKQFGYDSVNVTTSNIPIRF